MSVCGMTGPGLGLSVFLLALLHLLQCSAQNNYTTRPNNLTVAAGKPAAFQCGVSPPPRQLNFTLYGSHGNRTLICPGNHTDYLAAQDSSYFATLIGCVIGGFFGILIVIGLSYTVLRRSERFQRCFRGKDREDDVTTMVTKD
ncbi:unnamed protein product [Coregonus sp. 'balchen']|nr:unnamed protein product [Coregonus sp. 'balchen']